MNKLESKGIYFSGNIDELFNDLSTADIDLMFKKTITCHQIYKITTIHDEYLYTYGESIQQAVADTCEFFDDCGDEFIKSVEVL